MTSIDPTAAFQALQQFVSTEIARLYGEIAARDAFIAQLQRSDAAEAPVPGDPDDN